MAFLKSNDNALPMTARNSTPMNPLFSPRSFVAKSIDHSDIDRGAERGEPPRAIGLEIDLDVQSDLCVWTGARCHCETSKAQR